MKPFDTKLVMVALALATGVGKGAGQYRDAQELPQCIGILEYMVGVFCCTQGAKELGAELAHRIDMRTTEWSAPETPMPTVSANFAVSPPSAGDVGIPEPGEPDFGDDVHTTVSSQVVGSGLDMGSAWSGESSEPGSLSTAPSDGSTVASNGTRVPSEQAPAIPGEHDSDLDSDFSAL